MLATNPSMPSSETPKPEASVTPSEFFDVIGIGMGQNLNRRALVDFLKKHSKRRRQIIEKTRKYITKVTGYNPDELTEKASKCSFPATENCNDVKNNIRNQLFKSLPFLGAYTEEGREAGLRRTALEANAYTEKLSNHYFPGDASVNVESEVEIRNDAAKLVLMAFNDKADPKLNFDAARKLLLMKYIGKIRSYSKKDEDNDRALEYIMDLFNERVVEVPEGVKQGAKTRKYLVSHHAPDTYQTTHTEILDEVPEDAYKDSLTQITPIPFRKTTVVGAEGEREIFFGLEPREKLDESRLIKTLRYKCHVGEKDVDRNGLKLLFETREDWDDFFPMLVEEVKNEIRENLCERLEGNSDEDGRKAVVARLNNLGSSIEITEDPKDSLNGEGFKGNSVSSSEELKIYKFKMRVTRADGRKHHYEFQVFLPDGYADAEYRKGVSWEEYHADRFFQADVDTLLFPKHYYPELDHKKAHQKVMKLAHEKVWNRKNGFVDQMKSLFSSVKDKAKKFGTNQPKPPANH